MDNNENKIIKGVPKSGKLRKFGLVTYLDIETVKKTLHKNIDKIARYAYISHNNESEQTDNHIHILLYTYHANTYNAIKNWFPKSQNTFAKPILDDCKAVDYLTHINEPDKVQYNPDKIVAFNFELDNLVYDDNGYTILEDLLNNVPLRTIAKRYGKDFIYHYRAYRDLADDILFEESRPMILEPTQEVFPF